MDEEQIGKLNKLMLEYSNFEYLNGHYSKLVYYNLIKEKLIIILYVDGMPDEHIELIQTIVNKLYKILPDSFNYRLSLDGWFCEITNGNFDLKFKDGRYHIQQEHQEMHNRKEIATINEVAKLNNVEHTEFKWNILKKKSIELGFTPIKEKNGFENLYLISSFRFCYPEYNYNFIIENEAIVELNIEPKRKKFFGLF